MSVQVLKSRSVTGFIFSAWEASAIFGPHGTISFIGEVCVGRIGTKDITPEIDAVPVGPARSSACKAYREMEYERAYAAILTQFPEAAEGERDMGYIYLDAVK